MAAGGDQGQPTSTGRGVDLALTVLVVALLLMTVAGAAVAWQVRSDRASAATEQQRYGDVLTAARGEAEAFVNLRYDDAQAGIDRVVAGATGEFRERYTSGSDRVIEQLREDRSVMEGEVVHAGVETLEEDQATVLVATTGTLATRRTDDEPVERNFRLRLDLVLQDGRWLTDDLEFVG